MKLPATELRLADTVQLSGMEGYQTATVKQIETVDGILYVTFFRPYVSTADFSYTGGVICLIGVEEFRATPSKTELFTVLARKVLK